MQRNFNTQEAASYLEEIGTPFSPGTLEVWRFYGRGPRYKKIGRRIFYEQSALDDFSRGQIVETVDSISRRGAA